MNKNKCFSDFNIKGNGGAYKLCTAPSMGHLENQIQRVLQLDPGRKAFRTSTLKMTIFQIPHSVTITSNILTKKNPI